MSNFASHPHLWVRTIGTVLCVLLSAVVFAQSADLSRQVDFNVPAQRLSTALLQFSHQAALQVLIPQDLGDQTCSGVNGRRSVGDALNQLLANTGLSFKSTNASSISIVRSETPSPTSLQRTTNQSQIPSSNQLAQTTIYGLEEIVVTAQKKIENIQDVPLAVNAISSETLEKYSYTQLSDYAATVPGLQVDSGGAPGFGTITLRGISTGNLYGSTTTAVYVDDVPVGSSASYSYGASYDGLDLLPYDLNQVEVLKGPQGTLYGASSMGGLLKYVLGTPDLTQNTFRIGTDMSSTDGGAGPGYGVRAYGNIAVIPGTLAVSLSGSHTHSPGYISNVATGENGLNRGSQDGGRLAILWQPTAQLALKLAALINDSDFNGVAQIPLTPAGAPLLGYTSARWFAPTELRVRNTLYSANLSYDFGWAKLTSVTGYSDSRTTARTDATIYPFFGTVLGIIAPAVDEPTLNKLSEELRLSSPEQGPFQWTAGGFFTHENAALYERISALDPATRQSNPAYDPIDAIRRPSRFKEIAVYANATYQFTSEWDINGGVRYSHNDQSVSTLGVEPNGSGGYLFPGLPTPEYSFSEGTTTYSFSTRYHFLPESMLYARVATGYRPGGSNIGIAGAPATFSADTLTSYESGIKSEFLDKRLLLDADIFYIDWKNIQLGQYTAAHLIYTGNAAKASSDGVEVTTQYALPYGLRLGVNAVYNNAKLRGDAAAVGGANGDRLPLSPQWSGAVTGDWTHALSDRLALDAGVVWRFVGDRNTDFPGGGDIPGGTNFLHLSPYRSGDVSMGAKLDRWAFRLFARNVTNERAYLRYYAPLATILTPRTIGASVDVSF